MKQYTYVLAKKFFDDVEEGRTLSDAEFSDVCALRGDIFGTGGRDYGLYGVLAASAVLTAITGTYLSTRTVVEVSSDFFDKLPEERTTRLARAEVWAGLEADTRMSAVSDGSGAQMKTAPSRSGAQGGGDPRARVTQQGVLGIVSSDIKGKTVASADMFGKGGFATDIDAVLAGTSGGSGSGQNSGAAAGSKSAAGIGYGSGYGSGFGGSGIDDLLGGLMGSGGGGLQLKKRGELRVSSPNFLSGSMTSRQPRPRQAYTHSYDSERNEAYSSYAENRFKDAAADPLSTFSLDVDVASYANVRRMINQGRMPPADAVRVEQFINYFSYNYPNPTGKHPVSITTEARPSPWNKDFQLVRVGFKAKEIPASKVPASNLVFLVDVSGSMDSPNRLPLVKSSLKMLTNNLRASDRVSIVTYSDRIEKALPSTSGADRQKIYESLDRLYASGGTAGGAGIQTAYEVAQKNFIKGGNNRVILCTDGDFNIGISSPDELEKFIEGKRKTGVYLTVLGYGMGNYKDNMLQTLSQKGNGNHAYIDNAQEANRVLVKEFNSTMHAVANDVKLQVEFNPAYVSAYRLVGYESRMLAKEDFNNDQKDAGELGAGHTVTAFYEIIPTGVQNPFTNSVDGLKYQKPAKKSAAEGVKNNEMLNVKVRYKPIDSDKSVLMETPVMVTDKDKPASADFTFASAVAMFGQLLRDSEFKGKASYDDVVKLARQGVGDDPNGYRREFVRIAEAAKQLAN